MPVTVRARSTLFSRIASRGQNLQDCDCVWLITMYWNPVPCFGRVDRLFDE